MKWQVFAINLYLLPISDPCCQLYPWSNAMFDWSPPSNCSAHLECWLKQITIF